MIKSENARPNLWIYVDIRDRDLAGFVNEARSKVERELVLPAGYAVAWSGQFEYFERAAKRLMWVVPMTLAIIFILLFLAFNRMTPALLIIGTLPFAGCNLVFVCLRTQLFDCLRGRVDCLVRLSRRVWRNHVGLS